MLILASSAAGRYAKPPPLSPNSLSSAIAAAVLGGVFVGWVACRGIAQIRIAAVSSNQILIVLTDGFGEFGELVGLSWRCWLISLSQVLLSQLDRHADVSLQCDFSLALAQQALPKRATFLQGAYSRKRSSRG
jgi:hypothetical protein